MKRLIKYNLKILFDKQIYTNININIKNNIINLKFIIIYNIL